MAQKDDEKKPYTYTPFDPNSSTAYTTASGNATSGYDAWNTHNQNGFNFTQQELLDTVSTNHNNWLNTKFNYDFNADALYQQYKDKYIKQGKMAMQDTMGQAAALTGGYGNSYAATVGNQAYQASLENLNDVIPELYQMAYSMHQDKGQNLLNQLNLLNTNKAFEYGQWVDKGNTLYNNMNYWQTEANNIYDRESTAHNTNESMLYQAAQDAIEQDRWEKEYALNKRQVDMAESSITGEYTTQGGKTVQVGSSGSGNGSTTGGSGNTDKVIKNLQNYSTNKGQADYLASEINAGRIGEEEAMKLLDEYGVVDLVDRSWEMTDNGGVNWFGIGIDADAKVKDQYGNEYTLAALRKELKKTMSTKEAEAWIKNLEKKLGI